MLDEVNDELRLEFILSIVFWNWRNVWLVVVHKWWDFSGQFTFLIGQSIECPLHTVQAAKPPQPGCDVEIQSTWTLGIRLWTIESFRSSLNGWSNFGNRAGNVCIDFKIRQFEKLYWSFWYFVRQTVVNSSIVVPASTEALPQRKRQNDQDVDRSDTANSEVCNLIPQGLNSYWWSTTFLTIESSSHRNVLGWIWVRMDSEEERECLECWWERSTNSRTTRPKRHQR
jgi:hypothetical protein